MEKKRSIKFFGKTADCFYGEIKENGEVVNTIDGYPPSFLGSDGIDLEIDLDTGQVIGWKAPSEEEIQELIEN